MTATAKAAKPRSMQPTTKSRTTRAAGATEMVHVRVSDQLKKDATKTLEQIGLSLPEALRLFMHRVVVEQALPLRLEVPNATTRAAIEESRLRTKTRRFSSPAEMFDALEKAGAR